MATQPGREESLREALASLLEQVDTVHVYLNGFREIPKWLRMDSVEAHLGPTLGDAGKFLRSGMASDYCLTVDDDIIYPPDYVEAMIDHVERLGRRVCVGVHGAVFSRMPVSDYYEDRLVHHYRESLGEDQAVHILGTGTLCWHTSTIDISLQDFRIPNMADVWFALKAQQTHVPLVCIPRDRHWLRDTPQSSSQDSLWGSREMADQQTQTVNGYGAWRLIPIPAEDGKRKATLHRKGRFVVLASAHNTALFVEKCLASIASQTFSDWRTIFIDDASTDGTAVKVEAVAKKLDISQRLTLLRHEKRRYKTRNVVEAVIEHVSDNEIVVMLDGDDWLAHNQALEKLAAAYEGGLDVVWGNWVGSDGMPGSSWYLNPFLPPRRQPWVTSAPFSFRARLLKDVPDEEFKDDDGNWFQCACDQAIALPILERTIRRKHLEEVLYVYNRENPNSHDRQGARINPLVSERQAQASKVLYSRPAVTPPWDHEFFLKHRFEFVRAAMASAGRFGGDAARQHVQAELARLEAEGDQYLARDGRNT